MEDPLKSPVHDPEKEKRLRLLRERDFEAEQEKHIMKCHTWKFNIGRCDFVFNPIVTFVSAILIWVFVAWCIIDPEGSLKEISKWKDWVTDTWTWLYIGTQDVWAVFIIILYFSKYSNMKLGASDDEEPEFNNASYFTMLFSAGVAIGLFYFGVAETIYHYQPGKDGNRYWGRHTDNQRAQDALNLTLFHWGVHGWVVYVLIGLLLGFLCYRKGLPMTMRTCFYPLLGEKIYGFLGDMIDILSIVCTMFGVCTSLGLGVITLNAGINRMNDSIAVSTNNQIIIIWCVTAVATLSVMSGLKVGIRRLSEVCFSIGCLILLTIFFADKTWFLLNTLVQSIGYYLQWLVQLGFHTDAFAMMGDAPDGRTAPNWMDGWTIFYWGWWISWSPFVGMFIAKISRGRTIAEFIMYTLTMPILYSFTWLSIFGGVGIRMEREAENIGIKNCSMYDHPKGKNASVEEIKEVAEAVFKTYGMHRLSCRSSEDMWFDVIQSYGDIGRFLSILSLIAIVLYFVTSSDSGSLVIDCLSANGHPDPPIMQRIFWALTEGATATALLKAGGKKALDALQTASVAAGLPYTFILNWACIALWRAVKEEAGEIDPNEGNWCSTVFDINTFGRLKSLIINIFCPWYTLGHVSNQLTANPSRKKRIVHSLVYGVPFYLWLCLMISSVSVESLEYFGWSLFMGIVAYTSGLRGAVREKYGLTGNMVEDFFVVLLLWPFAIVQMGEQIRNGDSVVSSKASSAEEMDNIELGIPKSRFADADGDSAYKSVEAGMWI